MKVFEITWRNDHTMADHSVVVQEGQFEQWFMEVGKRIGFPFTVRTIEIWEPEESGDGGAAAEDREEKAEEKCPNCGQIGGNVSLHRFISDGFCC